MTGVGVGVEVTGRCQPTFGGLVNAWVLKVGFKVIAWTSGSSVYR